MSVHIQAKDGQVAKTVLMPGDPLRALHIANNYMKNYISFNGIRGMYGYTGESSYGKSFTVHPSGMGQPSLGIYTNEFFMFHGVETIIRIGTFGSYRDDVPCGSIFIPEKATTDSGMSKGIVETYPSINLFNKAWGVADSFGIKIYTGHLFSTDTFYDLKDYKKGEKKDWEIMAEEGVIGVEMESHTLFYLAEKHKKEAMTILVASDNLVTGEKMSAEERQTSVEDMMKIILPIV